MVSFNKICCYFLLILVHSNLVAQTTEWVGDTLPTVHDPVIIKQDSVYYVFATGQGINVFSSIDRKHWKREKRVFDIPPVWAVNTIPGYKGHTWAPDISYHNGRYYLYYSVSQYGKNTSAIGVASNATLHPASPQFKWVDHGKVLQSVPGRDHWNAIDPNLITDENNTPWLAFGSFWNGIKMVQLDTGLTRVSQPERWHTLAARKRSNHMADSLAGDAAIEAPFIYHRNNYYYLFVSFDYCCLGANSTYNIRVGRSNKVQGPYFDRDGIAMTLGGGTLVIAGNERWHGVGHNAVIDVAGIDYLLFHAYDATDKGRAKLQLLPIRWEMGWPEVKLVQ